ncbi:MAG TPA: hypothetical protein VLD67_10925 [Vicinamibacterales bacterium]|nr:hypothetical protein [Vicinamibacterales bacterium]
MPPHSMKRAARMSRTPLIVALGAAATLMAAPLAAAQTVEVTPFGGYRFGGGFFEAVTGQEVDLDGAPAVGIVVNVAFQNDLQIEALFTHQEGRVVVPVLSGPPRVFPVTVDHWLGGGRRELGFGPARSFLTGLLGLTRYGVPGDNEIRFTIGAGGGAKLLPTRHLGLRVDGRLLATFADIDGRAIACTPGVCLFALDATVLWQAELSAAVIVAF